MLKLIGWALLLGGSLVAVQVTAEVLVFRASFPATEASGEVRPQPAPLPLGRIHEVDRPVSRDNAIT